jgi:hypothetical protein
VETVVAIASVLNSLSWRHVRTTEVSA